MGRRPLTDEEKAERDAARKLKKQQERQAKWDERNAAYLAQQEVWKVQAEESRQAALAAMEPDFREKFQSCITYALNSKNMFVKDLAAKWMRFGNLSEKQITSLLNSVDRERNVRVIDEIINDWFVVGEKSTFQKFTIISIKEIQVDSRFGSGKTTKITMKNNAGIYVVVRTTIEKVIEAFTEIKDRGNLVKMFGKVKYHKAGTDTIYLDSRGLKIEEHV